MRRRKFLRNAGLAALASTGNIPISSITTLNRGISSIKADIVIIGAGVFGVWTAFYMQTMGAKVTLIDAYGPGNSRASSGGESRILRSDYGDRLMYSRMNIRAYDLWKRYQKEWNASFIYPSGRLNFYSGSDRKKVERNKSHLDQLGVHSEILKPDEMKYRWPQVDPDGINFGVYYPGGVGGSSLMARESCRIVSEKFVNLGGRLLIGKVVVRKKQKQLSIALINGEALEADKFIFACGPWMGKVFPELFSQRLNVYRRDVFFIGPAAGDDAYSHPNLPIFSFNNPEDARFYGMPDLRGRGVKIAPWPDLNDIDMDADDRINNPVEIKRVRAFIKRRFPGLVDQPILEGKVCQLTMSTDSHFIIDQHPEDSKVWFACAGSGHAFKHGPALGEYISNRVLNKTVIPEYDDAFKIK